MAVVTGRLRIGTARKRIGAGGLRASTNTLGTPTQPTATEVLTTVRPPEGTARHMDLPFTDPLVQLNQGWYYKATSPGPAIEGCRHPDGLDLDGWLTHCGIDFSKYASGGGRLTFQIRACADGEARWLGGTYGEVQLRHSQKTPGGNGIWTRYLHCDPSLAHVGTTWTPVAKGAPLAWAGNSGTSALHLHLAAGTGDVTSSTRRPCDPYDIAHVALAAGLPPEVTRYPASPFSAFSNGSNFAGYGPRTLFTFAP